MKNSVIGTLAGLLAQAQGIVMPLESRQLLTPLPNVGGAVSSLLPSVNSLLPTSLPLPSALPTNLPQIPDLNNDTNNGGNSCANGNTPTARQCWTSGFDIDTNYYEHTPNTGVTREYFLEAQNITLAPDGVPRLVNAFNGQIPGPTIFADWGDEIVIHVRNGMQDNGTAIHWHGIHQRNTNDADGTPGVTECPIVPGNTRTYRFRATQYGTSWYHSHFGLQYGDGLQGPIVIRGPTTANYDEDLGALLLNDWGHTTASSIWPIDPRHGRPPPVLENGLINGTNVFDCVGIDDPNCVPSGERFQTTFEPGKRYLIRLVSTVIEGWVKFTIDGHRFQVIANDFVPIEPYETDNILLGAGQRYDIVVEADQEVGNYWLRSLWQNSCTANLAGGNGNIRGIVRYEGADTTADPTTEQWGGITDSCGDEDPSHLVPHLALDVGNGVSQDELILSSFIDNSTTWFYFTFNGSNFQIEWEDPTALAILDGNSSFPRNYNSYPVTPVNQWVYWIIQAEQGGIPVNHPIHLHGHDFWVIGQGEGQFDPNNPGFNLQNPMRRDVANLPIEGWLAMAFYTDNPGAWLIHCHIAWHASLGMSFQFIERENEIAGTYRDQQGLRDQCDAWAAYEATMPYHQDDSDDESASGKPGTAVGK